MTTMFVAQSTHLALGGGTPVLGVPPIVVAGTGVLLAVVAWQLLSPAPTLVLRLLLWTFDLIAPSSLGKVATAGVHAPDNLEELQRAITAARAKLDELNTQVEAKEVSSAELSKKIDELKTLADTSQQKVDAIGQVFGTVLEKHDKREFRKNTGVGVLFMLGGGLIGLAITMNVPAFDCHPH